jgi:transcriptional regulator with XRE-family HTH domain
MTETTDLVELLGRHAVIDGKLAELRHTLGISLSYMSELMDVSISTYRNWELTPNLGVLMRDQLAIKVGRFVTRAAEELDHLAGDGLSITQLIPFYMYAEALGQPVELIMDRWRRGQMNVETVDLGILGIWMFRHQLPHLGMVA